MTDKPKRPRDANQLAHMIAGIATGDDVKHEPDTSGQRKGGLKGGKARAAALTPGRRQEIAKNAAAKRWSEREATKE